MKIFYTFDKAGESLNNILITIGNFDGVHLGHQKILTELKKTAAENNWTPLVVTFVPHPLSVIAPEKAPPFLTTLKMRLKIIQSMGINNVLLASFNKNFAEITPEKFIKDYLIAKLKIKGIVIGENYLFGKNKQGNIDFLKKYGEINNFIVNDISPVIINEKIVSSTLIRSSVQIWDLKNIKKYLGRDYSISGKVVVGSARGRDIGFPTINLQNLQILLPPRGVYHTKVIYKNQELNSITNIGVRPTFGEDKNELIETHILDFNENLYHQEITIVFLEKIRDEKKFSSIEELKKQIIKDIDRILNKEILDTSIPFELKYI